MWWKCKSEQTQLNITKYAKQQKAKQKQTEKTLETEILKLEQKLDDNITDDEKCETRAKLARASDQLQNPRFYYKVQNTLV